MLSRLVRLHKSTNYDSTYVFAYIDKQYVNNSKSLDIANLIDVML